MPRERQRGKAVVIGGFTQTTATQFSRPNERFVPGWDRQPAMGQEMAHIAPRRRMGRKLTPTGPGTLRPAREITRRD
jgi:hypothetical protein